jgi:hypothetical protein
MEDEDRLMRVGDVPDEDRDEQLPAEPELPQPDGPDEGLLPDEDEEPDSPEVGRPFPGEGPDEGADDLDDDPQGV